MFGIEQWAQSTHYWFVVNSSILNIAFALLVAWACVRIKIKGLKVWKDYPMAGIYALLLYGYTISSTVWAPVEANAFSVLMKGLPYIIMNVLLAPLILRKADDIANIAIYQIIVGVTVSVFMLVEAEWVGRRILMQNGELGNPLTVAQVAAYTIIFASLCNIKIWGGTLLRFIVIGICFILIVKTGSRGQLIATVVATISVWPIAHKVNNAKSFVSLIAICVIVGILINWGLSEYWQKTDRWESDELTNSFGGRLENAFRLLEVWFNNPLYMIIGMGNSASYDPSILGIYPHFVPLEILAEEGVIGFILYTVFIYHVYKSARIAIKLRGSDDKTRSSLAVLLAIFALSFLLSLKQGSLILNTEFFMAGIMICRLSEILKRNHLANMQ